MMINNNDYRDNLQNINNIDNDHNNDSNDNSFCDNKAKSYKAIISV